MERPPDDGAQAAAARQEHERQALVLGKTAGREIFYIGSVHQMTRFLGQWGLFSLSDLCAMSSVYGST